MSVMMCQPRWKLIKCWFGRWQILCLTSCRNFKGVLCLELERINILSKSPSYPLWRPLVDKMAAESSLLLLPTMSPAASYLEVSSFFSLFVAAHVLVCPVLWWPPLPTGPTVSKNRQDIDEIIDAKWHTGFTDVCIPGFFLITVKTNQLIFITDQ